MERIFPVKSPSADEVEWGKESENGAGGGERPEEASVCALGNSETQTRHAAVASRPSEALELGRNSSVCWIRLHRKPQKLTKRPLCKRQKCLRGAEMLDLTSLLSDSWLSL